MKTRYRVLVQEKYSKWVEVLVEDPDLIDSEIEAMESSGEIEWDYAGDFDEWNILNYEKAIYSDYEVANAKKWCKDQVTAACLIDREWIEEEMTRDACFEWLEQMRDNGMDIPECIDSGDLWDAVLERRKERETHAQV